MGNVIKKPAQRPDARRVLVTDSSLKAKEKHDTAQMSADTKAFFSSCPTGTDLIIKGKEQEFRVSSSLRAQGAGR